MSIITLFRPAMIEQTSLRATRLSFPSVVHFLKRQVVYLALAAVVVGTFWAIGQRVNPATVLLYSLCFGNLISPVMSRVHRRLSGLPFPYNGLIFLAVLLAITPAVYALSSLVVWRIAPPSPQSLSHLILTGWKLPFLMILVYGMLAFFYTETKRQLELRNLELQRSVELGAAQLEEQEQELERAREIQQALLPKDIPQLPGFEIATAWQPARLVGGDYFDVLRLDEKRLALCVADVVGKGVSAALLMANVQASVRAFARDSNSPARVCSRVNMVLCENIATGKFVSLFYGILDAAKHTFEYCNAGHPRPKLVSSDSVRELSGGGAVLGVFPTWKYKNSVVALSPGDTLLLFTDGITEAAASDGSEFGEDRLARLAKLNSSGSARELNRRLLAQVAEFCQGRFQDDATLLVIAVK